MRNTSWQEKLGQILGGLIGNNYYQKEFDRRSKKIQTLEDLINPTQAHADDFLKNNPELSAALQNPNMSDEEWDNLAAKYGGDVSRFKDFSNFYRNITQYGLDYNNASDDIGRTTAHTRAEELRRQFAEKYNITGFSKDDIINEETLRKNTLPYLQKYLDDVYMQDRMKQYIQMGGNPNRFSKKFSGFQ